MSKKIIIRLCCMLLAVLVVFSMTACVSNSSDTSTDTQEKKQEASQAKKEDKTSEKQEKEYDLIMAIPTAPGDPCVEAFFKFEELVEAKTNGRINVEVMHSAQLGSHRDNLEGLQMGSIQAAEISTAVLSSLDPKFSIFDLPYLADGMDDVKQVLDDGVDEILDKAVENSGIKIIGWMVRCPRSVFSSKGPIETADDFNGLKIRVMESPVMIRTMELLGAVPTPLAAAEIYMSLQTKVVDAAENSLPYIVAQKMYEVTDYFSYTEHFCTPNAITMSKSFYDNLPSDLQDIVLECGKEAGEYMFKLEKEQMDSAVKELEANGVKINQVPDKSSFKEKVAPIYDEYKDVVGQDLIDMFRK